MKIYSAKQIKEWDQFTILNEPITSLDLMERASKTFVEWFIQQNSNQDNTIHIFCGPGNNGGDALAIARLLYRKFYNVSVYIFDHNKSSPDFQENLNRLPKEINKFIINIKDLPQFNINDVIIDGIFGSGLNRNLEGDFLALIKYLNQKTNSKISIDIPSGLFADQKTESIHFIPDHTFSFELPKLSFLIPDNNTKIGKVITKSIGLSKSFNARSDYYYLNKSTIKALLKPRNKFAHKGNFGHAMIIAGSYGKTGAALLAIKACLKTGVGLVTAHIPENSLAILQSSVPEAMCSIDKNDKVISTFPDTDKFQAIGIGPGLGLDKKTQKTFISFLEKENSPLVLDADALNIISLHSNSIQSIPKGSIITPHPKEFERLFGACADSWERMKLCKKKAVELNINIVLKGAHTFIALSNGKNYFNSTGNPGMATAGSGDVLTGMITSLVAQGYSNHDACLIGVFVHGYAGDFARDSQGEKSLMASDIIHHLSTAFLDIQS